MPEVLNMGMLHDYLTIGAVGWVVGVLAPMGFRLIGYVVDSVKVALKGNY